MNAQKLEIIPVEHHAVILGAEPGVLPARREGEPEPTVGCAGPFEIMNEDDRVIYARCRHLPHVVCSHMQRMTECFTAPRNWIDGNAITIGRTMAAVVSSRMNRTPLAVFLAGIRSMTEEAITESLETAA